jgi:Flp pilus assembly protein TadG
MNPRDSVRRVREEEGQAIILVALAMSIFLVGAVGLAIDGAHLYAQRQMAQSAADAAAQAGIMSIFDNTYNQAGNPAAFSTGSTFTCGATDARTPCAYAILNGFNTANDTVTVSFPPASAAPGVNLATNYPVTLLQVNIQRQVSTTLMGLLGTSASTIQANAIAAIVQVLAPVPILVTHPTLTGSFSIGGTPLITICGGPSKSIQVDSNDPAAAQAHGNATVNLSHAGPPDPGNCTTGTGADFGVWGGPSAPPFIYNGGSTGKYLQPASPMQDPLAGVAPPPVPSVAPNPTPLGNGVSGCPASPRKPCMLYSPGLYPGGIDGKLQTVMFEPGIYYLQGGGIGCSALCDMYMATGFTDPVTGTGWTGNMLIYNTGSAANPTQSGSINLGANGNVALVGAPANSQYLGMLMFEDRNAAAQTHSLGGGGAMTLQGTIYLTNTRATMLANAAQYQALQLQGGSGSGTLIEGEIIVGTLSMGGNGAIQMNLNNNALDIQEVALVE